MKWESVKAVLLGFGRLNVSYLVMLRKVNFYRHLYTSKNRILSCALHSLMLRHCDVMTNSVLVTSSLLYRQSVTSLRRMYSQLYLHCVLKMSPFLLLRYFRQMSADLADFGHDYR